MKELICIIGPTASGKSARAIELAKEMDGEVISVDSRQVYRTLDIGTEKLSESEMQGVPHHLIDIREPEESYSAGEFAVDAARHIEDIEERGKTPILAGGTHFYFDALLYDLPVTATNAALRSELEVLSTEELFTRIQKLDPRRAERVEPGNRRRLTRALEIIEEHGAVPERSRRTPRYTPKWIVIDPSREELRPRIDARLTTAFSRGLKEEVRRTRERVGDARLDELGLEYRIVGEYLRGERSEASLLTTLSSRLWHFARHQKAWIRKLTAPGEPEI